MIMRRITRATKSRIMIASYLELICRSVACCLGARDSGSCSIQNDDDACAHYAQTHAHDDAAANKLSHAAVPWSCDESRLHKDFR